MQNDNILNQITELTTKISNLPKGYISKKSINGKLYYYHQWSEKGKKQSKYLKDNEIEALSEQINLRKELQEQLRNLRQSPKNAKNSDNETKIRNEVTKMLLVRCYGLSLSDQYWICPKGSGLTWDEINFFDNDFSDDIGDVLFGTNKKPNVMDLSSPDNTSDGNLKKRWKIIDGRRYLVPAWRIIQTQKKVNSISVYQHFVNCCESLGAKNVVHFLDRMIVLDYIIANEDRHLNNFGLLRNAETLEWYGFAPIYDSGSSLGYDKVAGQIRSERDIECKPFKKHHVEQLKLVSDFSWIDFASLADVDDLIKQTLSADGAKEYIDESRIQAIAEAVNRRIQNLLQLSMIQTPVQTDSTEDDVDKDIAQDYFSKITSVPSNE